MTAAEMPIDGTVSWRSREVVVAAVAYLAGLAGALVVRAAGLELRWQAAVGFGLLVAVGYVAQAVLLRGFAHSSGPRVAVQVLVAIGAIAAIDRVSDAGRNTESMLAVWAVVGVAIALVVAIDLLPGARIIPAPATSRGRRLVESTVVVGIIAALVWSALPRPIVRSLVTMPARPCRGVGTDLVLTGDPYDPEVAWGIGPQGPTALHNGFIWPDGYTARFDPRLEILDGAGNVVLREGDRIEGGCVLSGGGFMLQPPFN